MGFMNYLKLICIVRNLTRMTVEDTSIFATLTSTRENCSGARGRLDRFGLQGYDLHAGERCDHYDFFLYFFLLSMSGFNSH